MMARPQWIHHILLTAAILSLSLLVVADPDLAIPTKCPKVDPVNATIQLGHESDCTKFYKCNHGKKILMDCPLMDDEGNRLHFNPKLQLCDWPWNVDCKLAQPIVQRIAKVEIPTKCPKMDPMNTTVHLAHEQDCTKFYKCSYGKKYEMDCPVGNAFGDRLHFNAALQVCDWPENANCDVTVQCKGSCPTEDEDGDFIATLQHKEDCAKYCLCQRGVGKIMDCPSGMNFDLVSGVCDDENKVECHL